MELKKRHIVFSIVTIKIYLFACDRKDELYNIYSIIIDGHYVIALEKTMRVLLETLEYIVTL